MICARCEKAEATQFLSFDIDLPTINVCEECMPAAKYELMRLMAPGSMGPKPSEKWVKAVQS